MSDSVQPHRQQPTRLPLPWDSPGKNAGVGCHFLLQCMKVKSESEVTQSCPTPSNLMDCSLTGSAVHGIFQASVLEWVPLPSPTSHALNFLNDLMKQIYYHYDYHPILQTKKWRHREFQSKFDILKQKTSDKETES